MHRLPKRRTRTYILRIWVEYLTQIPPTWRGEVEDVTTKEVRRFRSWKEFKACIRRCSSDDPDPQP